LASRTRDLERLSEDQGRQINNLEKEKAQLEETVASLETKYKKTKEELEATLKSLEDL
jgi:peptidoglycan hydrolase CwlO-like protein